MASGAPQVAHVATLSPGAEKVYRHPWPVRISHWLNLLFLLVLLGSGLQIFNAHPALYWGSRSDADRALLSMEARRADDGTLQGITTVLGREFVTTGVLGVSEGPAGMTEARGFPSWSTIPGPRWLAMGRRWHFFFAWLFVINWAVYAAYTAASPRHRREFFPGRHELRGLSASLRNHLSLRRLRVEAAHGYNVLQKLSYIVVIFAFVPLIILTGLTMSPWLDTAFPWLLDLFGGRQSARTVHFLAALGFVLFTLVHVAMLLLVGPLNHLRAMITGRLRVPREDQL